jgi:hypothetical protein
MHQAARRTRRRHGEIAITQRGKSIATWGEGLSYTGPGGVWINREQ